MLPLVWHCRAVRIENLPRGWDYRTEDDHGYVFSFFWQPLAADLDHRWHPVFHEALQVIRRTL